MICAHGDFHLPQQGVLREAHFASSGPLVLLLFPYLLYSPNPIELQPYLSRLLREPPKSADPGSLLSVSMPSQERSQVMSLSRSQVMSLSQSQGCSCCSSCLQFWLVARLIVYPRDTHTHTEVRNVAGCTDCCTHIHRAMWVVAATYNTNQTHTSANSSVLFLPSRRSEWRFSGENTYAFILHIHKHAHVHSPLES